MVPGGQVRLSDPAGPLEPCAPVEPDTVLGPQSSAVLFAPATPADGVLPDAAAYEAVNAIVAVLNGTLAVTAERE